MEQSISPLKMARISHLMATRKERDLLPVEITIIYVEPAHSES